MHRDAPVVPDAHEAATDVAPTDIVNPADERWNWRWRSWTRWPLSLPIVVLAFVTVVVDVGTAWADISLGALGRVPITPALPLGILLALLVGVRRLGLDPANRWAWREFLVVSSVALVYAAWSYAVHIGGTAESIGLVLAALGEELVYRLAVLIVVGVVVAAVLRRPWRNAEDWGAVPGIVALLAGGLVFTLLPGHIAQMNGALTALPFASLGVVLGYAVLRTGALLPAAVVHSFLNIATIAVIVGDVSIEMRTAFAGVALIALVSGTIVAGMRLGILRRAPVTLDLRKPTTA
jgi:membrane protease YdiL (CAAX protease family)